MQGRLFRSPWLNPHNFELDGCYTESEDAKMATDGTLNFTYMSLEIYVWHQCDSVH